MIDKVQKIRENIEKRYERWKEKEFNSHSIESEIRMSECQHLLLMLDSLQEESVSKEIGDYDHKAVMEALHPELKEEPVSEELEEAAHKYADIRMSNYETAFYAFMSGAKWHKEQMMAKAVDVEVKVDAGGYPYIPQMELYDYDKDVPLAKEGDRYKVILIKEG